MSQPPDMADTSTPWGMLVFGWWIGLTLAFIWYYLAAIIWAPKLWNSFLDENQK